PRAPVSAKRQGVSVARHDLAVEHRCLSWQPVQQLRDGRKTLSEVVPIATEDNYARAHLVGLHTVAAEFHLVHPGIASGHALGRHGATRLNERGHTRPGEAPLSVGKDSANVSACFLLGVEPRHCDVVALPYSLASVSSAPRSLQLSQ